VEKVLKIRKVLFGSKIKIFSSYGAILDYDAILDFRAKKNCFKSQKTGCYNTQRFALKMSLKIA
jgi:hypothetical protein